jgi:DNA-binding CsgD family transcriptional regulator/tetratricopeptide (TPR) repeat protein
MPGRDAFPLLERDGLLKSLDKCWSAAREGRGRLVLVGGEAGIGKTSLVNAFTDSLAGVSVLRGACDNLATREPLGPLHEAVPCLVDELEAAVSGHGVRFRNFLAGISRQPNLMVIEDVHWADEATLDFLAYTAQRVASLPLLVIATYRADQYDADHPLSLLVGELATSAGVARIDVPALSPSAVAQLAQPRGLDAERLFRLSGGNPFYVTEMVVGSNDAPGLQLPSRVQDAVLLRLAQLPPDARAALDAAAILNPVDAVALGYLVGESAAIDTCVARGFLAPSANTQLLRYSFRHELVRESVVAGMSLSRARDLHAKALAWFLTQPVDHLRLAHHASGCGDSEQVLQHAPVAAQRAASLGAHREAIQLLEMSIAHAGALDSDELGSLLMRCAEEYLRIDHREDARRRFLDALAAFRVNGDQVGIGTALLRIGNASGIEGAEGVADAIEYVSRGVAILEQLEPGPNLARGLSGLAQLRSTIGEHQIAVELATRGAVVAQEYGDLTSRIVLGNGLGMATSYVRPEEGEAIFRDTLALATTSGDPDQVASLSSNLATLLIATGKASDALEVTARGLATCDEHELLRLSQTLLALQAAAQAALGHYADAHAKLETVLGGGAIAGTVRVPAEAIRRVVRARTGSVSGDVQPAAPGTQTSLDVHYFWLISRADAETAWILDEVSRIPDLLHSASGAASPWIRGEVAWWLSVAGVRTDWDDLPRPFALMLDGEWQQAAAAWHAHGWPLWQAYALGRSPAADDVARALEILDGLGASGARQAVLRDRLPADDLPLHRPTLTNRQQDVLRLLVSGHSNADIAATLFLSERTVEHHVSAILKLLGARNRTAAVHKARSLGYLT